MILDYLARAVPSFSLDDAYYDGDVFSTTNPSPVQFPFQLLWSIHVLSIFVRSVPFSSLASPQFLNESCPLLKPWLA